ncbi:hypothetical protein NQ314_018371 [Rhamnusium bicolor]|uniref:Uncharacterized protein n=1 Tax=Rhamnusium bicolor TaxID=1586634 RepID=A0AAV8WQX3_9CUCU|nr:hypothetical protein NQ314_018371 [Rhamnusium bicolor]
MLADTTNYLIEKCIGKHKGMFIMQPFLERFPEIGFCQFLNICTLVITISLMNKISVEKPDLY